MLYSALQTSSTGIQAGNALLDVTSNNIANTDTNGFKRATVTFQDTLYTALLTPGAVATGSPVPAGTAVGNGVAVDSTDGVFTQGPLVRTDRPLDVAISGEGFLRVLRPDGTIGYTRDGALNVDSAGQLVTEAGFLVAPGITVPPDSQVAIGADGVVTAQTAGGVQTLGRIGLTRFVNPAGLARVGDNLFVASPAAGVPVNGAPLDPGFGSLGQGFLERSNVDVTTELTSLILAQQAVAFNARAVTASNELLEATAQLIPESPA